LPYNPFEKRQAKFEKPEKERTNNFMKGYQTFSLIRRTEDKIAGSFYSEDDLESFLRKKPVSTFRLTSRHRSNSPVSRNSASFDNSMNISTNRRSIYDNTIKVIVDSNIGNSKEIEISRTVTVKDLMLKYLELRFEKEIPRRDPNEIENILLTSYLSFQATIVDKDKSLEEAEICHNSHVYIACDETEPEMSRNLSNPNLTS
jgi:hypothetical protein